jgi:hypothetical protein
MTLIANRASRLFQENNVDVEAGGRKTDAAWDAALYLEMNETDRGVLEVTVICNFKFKDGDGAALKWSQSEQSDYMTNFRTACTATWNEKHRLTTASSVPAVKSVGVIFDIKVAQDMSRLSHSHYNLNVTKVPADWVESSVRNCGGHITNSEVRLDSNDFRSENKGATGKQRDSVHEFGHMLGYRDEYPAANANLLWLSDKESIMYWSEQVRDRHYTLFAQWLNEQYQTAADLAKEKIEFKVNGITDKFNGKL